MNYTNRALICMIMLMAVPSVTEAAIYKLETTSGQVIYTDMPPATTFKGHVSILGSNMGMRQSLPALSGNDDTSARQGRLTVYGQEGCGYCRKLREDLNLRGVPYDYINVTGNADAKQRLRNAGGVGTPYTLYEGQTYSGYSSSGLASFLANVGLAK